MRQHDDGRQRPDYEPWEWWPGTDPARPQPRVQEVREALHQTPRGESECPDCRGAGGSLMTGEACATCLATGRDQFFASPAGPLAGEDDPYINDEIGGFT